MAGIWKRSAEHLSTTFRVEGCLEPDELLTLGNELREAARLGARDVILDLSSSCVQTPNLWSGFRKVMEDIAHHGAQFQVQGAAGELDEQLQNAMAMARLRRLERVDPDVFSPRAG